MSKWKEQQEAEKAKKAEREAQEPESLESFEAGALDDMEKLHQAFRERAEKENKRVIDVLNCDYYFVVCFSNRDQLYEFCERTGLNPDEIYIDGRTFARKINRALKTPDTDFPKTQPFNRDFVNRAREKTAE